MRWLRNDKDEVSYESSEWIWLLIMVDKHEEWIKQWFDGNWLIVVCSDGLMWRVESKSEFDWIWMVGLRWWYVDM